MFGSLNAVSVLIKVGVVLAFIAVPVGSYLIVGHYKNKVAELEARNASLEFVNDMYEKTISFMEEQRKIEQAIDSRIKEAFDQMNEQIDKIVIDLNNYEDRESSPVLKETVRRLQELSK